MRFDIKVQYQISKTNLFFKDKILVSKKNYIFRRDFEENYSKNLRINDIMFFETLLDIETFNFDSQPFFFPKCILLYHESV